MFKPKTKRSTAEAVAHNGDLWVWNCGWSRRKDKHLARPLGHSTFRRAVQLLNHTQEDASTVLLGVDKPQRQWRRMTDNISLMSHELYGNVKMLATDGCHAIVMSDEVGKKTVSFDSLTELPTKGSFSSGKKIPRKPKMGSKVLSDQGLEMTVRECHPNGNTFKCEYMVEDDENPELSDIKFRWFHRDNLTVITTPKKARKKTTTTKRGKDDPILVENLVNKYSNI